MSKNADTRLTETITFIKAHPVPGFIGSFDDVVQGLNDWKRSASQKDRDTLSGLMSQDGSPNRPGNKADRAYRRAAILLKCALSETPDKWKATASLINGHKSGFADVYRNNLEAGRDGYYSSAAVAQQHLNQLRDHPETFLNTWRLIVNGKPASQRATYGFYMKDGSFKLDCNIPQLGKISVDAINVPATKYSAVQANPGNIQATLSSLDASCTLMLTTQFTGCCYCFMVNGGDLAAAHIDPSAVIDRSGVTGQQVSQAMRANGGFANGNGGTFKAYGRVAEDSGLFGYPQNAKQMIIVGVKLAGAWQVYAQIDMGDHRDVARIDN